MVYHHIKEVFLFPKIEKTINNLVSDGYKFIIGYDLLVTKEETTRKFNLFFTNGKKYMWVYYHTQLKWYTYDYDCVNVLHMEIMKLVFDLMLSKIRRLTNGKTKEKL